MDHTIWKPFRYCFCFHECEKKTQKNRKREKCEADDDDVNVESKIEINTINKKRISHIIGRNGHWHLVFRVNVYCACGWMKLYGYNDLIKISSHISTIYKCVWRVHM